MAFAILLKDFSSFRAGDVCKITGNIYDYYQLDGGLWVKREIFHWVADQVMRGIVKSYFAEEAEEKI